MREITKKSIKRILKKIEHELDTQFTPDCRKDIIYNEAKSLYDITCDWFGRDTYEDEILLSELKRYMEVEHCAKFYNFHTEGNTALIGCNTNYRIVITIANKSVIIQGTSDCEEPVLMEVVRVKGKTVADCCSAIKEMVEEFTWGTWQ